MLKKQIISLVLVCLMTLSPGTGFAAELTIESDALSESVTDLNKLGIMVGDDKGDFRGEANITRAEFSTIICRILGKEEEAKNYTASPHFTDVGGHWAENYINFACYLKIINGFGGGEFRPNEKITVAQAAKMLVCALGHEDKGVIARGFPEGYINKANQLYLFKALSCTICPPDEFYSTPCTRNYIAVMIHNALDAPLRVRIAYTVEDPDNERNFTTYDGEKGTEFKSLRTEHFGGIK